MDEFETIARLLRSLTFGAPEALDLLDDAAVIESRPGWDLVVTKDAVVAGVHFLADDPLDLVARKLLRVNLSDLAAKAADPFGYFLAVAWPRGGGDDGRALFADGLRQDQLAYGLKLLGGDTVSTPGPLTASVTLLGWTPHGAMVRRSGARPGDLVLVSGAIGDGGLGLQVAQDGLAELSPAHRSALAARYRLPEPRLGLRAALRRHASAAADVSDGLLADAGHIANASGVGLAIHLDQLPLSPGAAAWRALQPDALEAWKALASFGDDYEVVCTARPDAATALMAEAREAGTPLSRIGEVAAGAGLTVLHGGQEVLAARTGWRHS